MRAGFLMLALAFPVYLLWRGELGKYLALMQWQGTPVNPNATAPVVANQMFSPLMPTASNPLPSIPMPP